MFTDNSKVSNSGIEEKYILEKPPYICIIKYMNYQRMKVNNNLLLEINNICKNKTDTYQLENAEINTIELSQIRKLKSIFCDINFLQKEENIYMYYIFILLNLTPVIIKNLTRLLIANIYLKYKVKCLYNYLELIKRNNYLDDLISILQNLHYQNIEYLDTFVETIHIFFT